VNGRRRLADGDRLRIGAHEFLVTRVDARTVQKHTRATGILRLCSKCKAPYARDLVACPSCGAGTDQDEPTWSGSLSGADQAAWNVELLTQGIDRAIALGRRDDAERLMRRAAEQIADMVAKGQATPQAVLDTVTTAAARFSLDTEDATWIRWAVATYRASKSVPPSGVVERMAALAAKTSSVPPAELDELITAIRSIPRLLTVEEERVVERLAELHKSSTLGPPGLQASGGAERS
jgi:hypothetical protein